MKVSKDDVIAVIPARYNSKRFPGKLLAKLDNQPLIQYVYKTVEKTNLFGKVIVATDDNKIFKAIDAIGGCVKMTSQTHKSGTDRVAEICEKLDYRIIVNVQGDEPFINRNSLLGLIRSFTDPNVKAASLMHPFSENKDNPNFVKVVCDKDNYSLYFSRANIPFNRDNASQSDYFKHIGVYAFRKETLGKFVNLPQGKLEKIEKLEQLRLLENNIQIKMVATNYNGFGIDTPEDLQKARKMLRTNRT